MVTITKSGDAPIAEHAASVIRSDTKRRVSASYPSISVHSINGILFLLKLKTKTCGLLSNYTNICDSLRQKYL